MLSCCSVAQVWLTLCDPMDCSMQGFPVLHYLRAFAQIHVHWIDNAFQPSHPLLPTSPLVLSLSQHQGLFQWDTSSHQVAKVLEFQLQHQSFQRIFRIHFLYFLFFWFDLLAEIKLTWGWSLGNHDHFAWALSCVWLFVTPWTVGHQAPLSLGFSRQEYWSALPFPHPGDLPDPGMEPMFPVSPTLQVDSLPLSHQGTPSLESRKMSRLFQSILVHNNFVFIVKISQKEWLPLAALVLFTPCLLFVSLLRALILPNSQQPDMLQCDLMSALVLLCGSELLVHPPLTCPPSDFLLQHSWTWKQCYSHGLPS